MGYRSDWKMAFKAKTKEKLESIINWIPNMPTLDKEFKFDNFYTWDSICAQIVNWSERTDITDTVCTLEEQDWKCYEPWDAVTRAIKAHCMEQNVDFAYARLGEDPDDFDETWTNDDFKFSFVRKIGELEDNE